MDRDIPPGLWPDMREHGYDSDEFPDIYKHSVVPAQIVIIAGPVCWETRARSPAQSDTYWTGEAGPGPSHLDAVGGGEHNAWATRNTVFLAWNVLHIARMLTDAGGIPAYGNSTRD